ncbi:hypothetical protein TrVE_jg11476 [Triparma verrucosa]|uniref:Uncharacterized protein n=1 Tax=Triparma verrucosa TaxID=1606542 RepID=A0A9W7BZM2_9STRA|nr:hypothetical protein TrVE_jg11476 [Triparma verrucosa]
MSAHGTRALSKLDPSYNAFLLTSQDNLTLYPLLQLPPYPRHRLKKKLLHKRANQMRSITGLIKSQSYLHPSPPHLPPTSYHSRNQLQSASSPSRILSRLLSSRSSTVRDLTCCIKKKKKV